ncbi:alpha/beta fold hydrolase [Streptomyces cupreus]|uniref:Alpha/beta hydrolase n=1 Tax=Streptomyces cupreus TaxID=2759956 RepID=A0A7X1J683_9ACTN|nr:hypothetical protein [Streptomyces cupreus]MBC2904961.1 hypothetical protein [Streptomyces cupreus]
MGDAAPHWAEWSRTTALALLIRGENGWMPEPESQAMAAAHRRTELRTIRSAAHDVHLDQPERLHAVVREFLASTEPEVPR